MKNWAQKSEPARGDGTYVMTGLKMLKVLALGLTKPRVRLILSD